MKKLNEICAEFGIEELVLNDEEFAELCELTEKAISRHREVSRWAVIGLLLGKGSAIGLGLSQKIANPNVAGPLMVASLLGITYAFVAALTCIRSTPRIRNITLGKDQIMDDLDRNPSEYRRKLSKSLGIDYDEIK